MASAALETSEAKTTTGTRVAWLLPSAVLYWQPLMSEFSRLFPQTIVFTSVWWGYIRGFENAFKVKVVGDRKFFEVGSTDAHYTAGITYLPLGIIKELLQFKPQVVFTNAFGVWTILALLLKPIGRWRVIVAYEGSSPGVDFRHSALRLTLRRLLIRLTDALITNSEAGKAYLTEVLGAKQHQVFKRPYEVPDSKALQVNSQTLEPTILQLQKPVFVYIGQIIPRKGLHYLLQACTKLEAQGCHNYTVAIIGDGQQRQELQEFCTEHSLQDRVQWLGRVPYEQLGAYLNAADIFVLPTLEDTWGMVLLEAMALGKPVLCSRQAGAVELVTEGENGFRFDSDAPEDLATKMRCFIDQPDLITPMGKKSAQAMIQHTPEIAAKFLAEVTAVVLRSR